MLVLKSISKIVDLNNKELYCACFFSDNNVAYVEVTEDNKVTRLYANKLGVDITVLNDVYGAYIYEFDLILFKITKFDLEIYKTIDFYRLEKIFYDIEAMRRWASPKVWGNPTKAIAGTNYTLFYTDKNKCSFYCNGNTHTLGAVILDYYKSEGNSNIVEIKSDIIEVELLDTIYYFKIEDRKKFDLIITKSLILRS